MTMTDTFDDTHDDVHPPGESEVGPTSRDWTLPLDNIEHGAVLEFRGRFIGMGTSHRDTHINHDGKRYVERGISCSGCRWFESRIFTSSDGRYLLYTVGESIVPGEEPRYRGEWLISPYEVIDALTTFRMAPDTGVRRASLSYAARRVLAQAAHHDDDLRDAYEGRLSSL